MEKLKPFIEKLKSRAASQFSVIDCVSENYIAKAINQAYLDKNYNGSLVGYINSLQAKGLQKIQLLPFRKNGSSQKPDGPAVTIDFKNPSADTAQNNVAPAPPQMQMQPGLNAASFGLGMPEIMEGYAAKSKYEMLLTQFQTLQADYKEEREKRKKLSDKIFELTRENDQHSWEKTTVKEPSAIDKLLDTLAKNPTMIPQLMGAFKGGGGLNSPQPQEVQIADSLDGYTEMQRALCEMVGQCEDALCEDLGTLISRILENDKVFNRELKKLIETPNLKAVKNG